MAYIYESYLWECYDDGYDDYWDYYSLYDNPYRRRTFAHRYWYMGWIDAEWEDCHGTW